MTARFIPYPRDIEDEDPNFDHDLQMVFDKAGSSVAESVTAGATG
ncbi:hypothetical protein AB0J63_24980 [Streptosporangium canum]